MSKRVRLKDIVTALKKGQSPVSLGARYLGEGIERTAYVLGKWVIKQNSVHSWDDLRQREAKKFPLLRALGVPPVRTIYTPGWVVQPLLKLTEGAERHHLNTHQTFVKAPVDIHGGNVGYDHLGTLRAFDW